MPQTDEQDIVVSDVDWQLAAPVQEEVVEANEVPFICECKEWMRSACTGLPTYKEHNGKRYCVLHYPCKDKQSDFWKIFYSKLYAKETNFSGVWFPSKLELNLNYEFDTEADFRNTVFSEGADFKRVIFQKDAYFSESAFIQNTQFVETRFASKADFFHAKFEGEISSFLSCDFKENVEFGSTNFLNKSKAYFRSVIFNKGADFNGASFSGEADFSYAIFGGLTDFSNAYFGGKADFGHSAFKDYVKFVGVANSQYIEITYLDFQHTRIEKPERISFHSVTLRPHWFINTDARKFEFVEAKWFSEKKEFFWRFRLVNREIQSLKDKNIESPHELLSIACRRLTTNAEENNRYEEASDFRYMAMEAKRLETWQGWNIFKLHWWYWALSGYGEDIVRAFIWLIIILLGFTLLYTQVGFEKPIGSFWDALIYSLNVIALQKPEPKAFTTWAKFCIGFETILGPLQAALLALAIRRKFMR